MVSIRKLAALDIAIHGAKLIVAEFAAGVILPLAIGVLSLLRGRAYWQIAFGIYMLCLGLNYFPLLIYGTILAAKENAESAVAAELKARDQIASKYAKQSLLLLVPLVVPIAALLQLRKTVDG